MDDASGEDRAAAEGEVFANNADTVAWVQFKMTGLEHFGVTEVDIHLAGPSLNKYVRTHRRDAGSRVEFNDLSNERDFPPEIIGLQLLRTG